jgi:hypothetical protein
MRKVEIEQYGIYGGTDGMVGMHHLLLSCANRGRESFTAGLIKSL